MAIGLGRMFGFRFLENFNYPYTSKSITEFWRRWHISLGTWGQRHLDYLKQYRKVTYINLLTSGRLNTYLADIDRQAQERSHRLIEGMKQSQGKRNS